MTHPVYNRSVPATLFRKRLAIAAGIVAVLAGGIAVQRLLAPRTISVRAAVTPSFQLRPEWRKLLDARMAAVSKIYAKVGGPRFKVTEVQDWSCSPGLEGVDACRLRLRDAVGPGDNDIVVGFVSQDDANRFASVIPFSRAAVMVDVPRDSEEHNRLVLAHELAHLFAASHPPAGEPASLMSEKPVNDHIDSRAAGLLRDLSDFDFKVGLEKLDAAAEARVVKALAASFASLGGNPVARARRVLGVSLQAEGRLAAAIRNYKLAVDADPAFLAVRVDLATAYAADHQSEAAIEQLRRVVAEKPDFPGALPQLAALLAQAGHGEEALQLLDGAIQADPKNPLLRLLRGTALVSQVGRLDDAIAELQLAVNLAPNSNEAVRNLVRAQGMKQQLAEAVRQQQEQVRQRPGDGLAMYNLGVAQARQGQVAAAAASFRRAIQLAPKLGEPHANLAAMLYLQGQYAAAAAEAATARSLGARVNPKLLDGLAKKGAAGPR